MLFTKSEKIMVAISGGKDSLSLLFELNRIGYNVTGLFIDLSIPSSSGSAKLTVKEFCEKNRLPLIIKSLSDEGLAIPDVKKVIKRPVCSECGKIKRYFFNKIALMEGFDALATGHNLDDEVSRLVSNTMRWDISYLADQGPLLDAKPGFIRKVKPLWRLTEYEIANYAYLRGIEHHHAPCPYSKGASFTFYKNLMYRIENEMPGRKLAFYIDFLKFGHPIFMRAKSDVDKALSPCKICSSPTSEEICAICRLKENIKKVNPHPQ